MAHDAGRYRIDKHQKAEKEMHLYASDAYLMVGSQTHMPIKLLGPSLKKNNSDNSILEIILFDQG